MGEDCNCLSQKIEIYVFHKRPVGFWKSFFNIGSRYIGGTIITVHGSTLKEVDENVAKFKKDYEKEFNEPVTMRSGSL